MKEEEKKATAKGLAWPRPQPKMAMGDGACGLGLKKTAHAPPTGSEFIQTIQSIGLKEAIPAGRRPGRAVAQQGRNAGHAVELRRCGDRQVHRVRAVREGLPSPRHALELLSPPHHPITPSSLHLRRHWMLPVWCRESTASTWSTEDRYCGNRSDGRLALPGAIARRRSCCRAGARRRPCRASRR